MNFANKGISSFLVLALMIIIGITLINFLPFILLIAAVVIGISYIIKTFKKLDNKKTKIFNKRAERAETASSNFSEPYTSGNIIDVEYTEVK